MNKKNRLFFSIQYLRALAALMVIGVHLQPQWDHMNYAGTLPEWLIGGVDIFFVISGFIMWQTTRGRHQTPLDFYARRIIRIVPLYWAISSFVVLLLLLAPHLLQTTRYDSWHIISSYLFIPSLNPGSGQITPVLVPGWTLNYEMFFYVLFGLCLLLTERWRITSMALILSGAVLLQMHSGSTATILEFYSSSIVLEFLLGMLLAWHLNRRPYPVSPMTAGLTLTAGLVLMAVLPETGLTLPRVVDKGLPALLIVAGALWLEAAGKIPQQAFLLLIGNASYSLYLIHPIALSAVSQLWRKLGWTNWPFWSPLLFSASAIAASLLAALLIYRWFEVPVSDYLLRLYRKRQSKLRALPRQGREADQK